MQSAAERTRERAALASAAAELALELPDDALDRLSAYLDLLERWNRVYNLTSVRDRDAMRVQHLNDCLAVARPVERALATIPAPRVLDAGSGAGLPGVVLAIALPRLAVTCVDAVGKKAAFVQQVAAALQLDTLISMHARLETLTDASHQLVTSRAFAALPTFVARTRGALDESGVWMAMQSRTPARGETLPSNIDMFHVEPIRVPGLDATRCLVWMRDTKTASAHS